LLFQQLAIPHESLHEQDHELMAQRILKRLKSHIIDKIMIFDPGERTSEIHHQQKKVSRGHEKVNRHFAKSSSSALATCSGSTKSLEVAILQ
jgi:hypothetical protein